VVRNLQYQDFQGHEGPVVAIKVWSRTSTSEEKIITAGLDNTVRVWDATDMICRQVLTEKDGEITCMTMIREKPALLVGNENGSLRLWNIETGKTLCRNYHENSVTAITEGLHNMRRCLFSTGYDGKVGVWNVICEAKKVDLELVLMEEIDEKELLCATFSFDEASGLPTDADVVSSRLSGKSGARDSQRTARSMVGSGAARGVLFCAGNSSIIHMLDPQHLDSVARLEGHTDAVTCLCIDGYFLFSGSDDSTVRIWNIHTRTPLKKFSAHTKALRSISVAPEEGYLISCSHDGSVYVWDYTKEEMVDTHRYREEVRCVAFQESRKRIFAGTEDKNLVVFPLNVKVEKDEEDDTGKAKADDHNFASVELGLLGLTVDEDLRRALEENDLA